MFRNHPYRTLFERYFLESFAIIRLVQIMARKLVQTVYYTHDFETQKNLSHKRSVLFYGTPCTFHTSRLIRAIGQGHVTCPGPWSRFL